MNVQEPRWGTARRGVAAALAALALHAAGAAQSNAVDHEAGMPIIETILPSRYNTPATPVGPQVFALAALGDGSIVAANNAGLLRLAGTGARTWNPTHGNVLSLATAADGTVYVGGIGEIGYFREFGGEFVSLASWAPRLGVHFGDFWISVAAADGSAYFADATRVFRWDGRTLRIVYAGTPELLIGTAFGRGAAILDPGSGLVAIDADGAHLVRGGERLRAAGPCALASASDGVVSLCSDGSVVHWTADGNARDLDVDAGVRAILKDAGVTTAKAGDDDGVLVGTRRAGMLWLDRRGALVGRLSGVPEWGDSRVFSLLLRRDEGFWVGLDYGLAHVEWPGQLDRYDALLGLPRAALATIRVGGELLAATSRGVYRIGAARPEQSFVHFEPYVPTRMTLFAMAQAAGTLFLASGDGVHAVKNGADTRIDAALAYAVLPLDRDGTTLLCGGLDGARLLRRRDALWTAHDLPGIANEIRHMQIDDDGAIWLSGNYAGVYRLHLGADADATPAVEHFGAPEGLPEGRVNPLRLPGGIVFETREGPMRFDTAAQRFVADAALRTLLPVADGDIRAVAAHGAGRALVVQHDRVRLVERSADGAWRELATPLARLPRGLDYRDVRVDDDGSIWIAGNEALFRHRPQTQSTLPALPRPHVEIEGADAASRDGQGAFGLGVAPRSVRARFDEAFFVGIEQLRFRTRLTPVETAWSEWQQTPAREVTRLPGGRYRLEVEARDIFGRQSETAGVDFALEPPWYLRWWAFAGAALVLAATIAALVQRREQRLRVRADELAALVRERTQELERASITDALTGLRNRHYMQIAGTPWQEHTDGSWLIALVDIDHFKRINDERGHAAGDEVLRAVGRELSGALRADDIVVRWGGEEFLVIIAIETTEQAIGMVRRLLHAIGDTLVTVPAPPALSVTCSIGWDLVPAGARVSLDYALGRADRNLYAAKHAGRDCACGPSENMLIQRV